MTRWHQRVIISALAVVGLLALLLWWWLRRRPQEEVILRTRLGTISRVRGIGGPAQVSDIEELAPHDAEKPVPPTPAVPARVSEYEEPVPREMEEPPADDLTRIEGIGPKISEVLQAAGITGYAQLALTDVDRLKQILAEAGIRIADPGTWPEQARLAAAGDWEGLKGLQGGLKAGRRV